jgi:hypothetical protein
MKMTPQRENLKAPLKQLDDVFLMRKGDHVATCELWTHAFGWECRLFAGAEMIDTQVCRNDAEIEAFREGVVRSAHAQRVVLKVR